MLGVRPETMGDSEMSETSELLRPEARAGAWRALALSLLAVLSALVAFDVVRAGAAQARCPCDVRPAPREVAARMAPLPPEWRWTPPVVPIDVLYGTPSPP